MKVWAITQVFRIIQVQSFNFLLTEPNRKERGKNIIIYIKQHFFLLNNQIMILRVALWTKYKIMIDLGAQLNMVPQIVTIRISSSADLTLDKLKPTIWARYTQIDNTHNRMIDWAVPGSLKAIGNINPLMSELSMQTHQAPLETLIKI